MSIIEQHVLWAIQSAEPMPITLDGIKNTLRLRTNLFNSAIDSLTYESIRRIDGIKSTQIFEIDAFRMHRP